MSNTAVGLDRISRVVGYKILKGDFSISSPNLPIRIAILGQGNITPPVTLSTTPRQVTSAKETAEIYGYGSPLHQIMRILRPNTSEGVGGIPTVIYPQANAGGATATSQSTSLTITTTATDSSTHYVYINGRSSVDGTPYAYSVVKGDTASQIGDKIRIAVNAVLGSPVVAAGTGATVLFTTKYNGSKSTELTIRYDAGKKDCGITYVTGAKVDGTGSVDLATTLTQLGGSEWNTFIVNTYGSEQFDNLETLNGVPDPEVPTGRYSGIVWKPFIAVWGSTVSVKGTLTALVSSKTTQVTNALAPAPNSEGTSWEAAANMVFLAAITYQNNPHLDVAGKQYPDMPVAPTGLIGDLGIYDNRDYLAKNGISTVDLVAGAYTVQDFLTTYHPTGEVPPQYASPRNLIVDFNVRYGYFLREQSRVVDHVILPSNQTSNADKTIKPSEWKSELIAYADDLANRALISDATFMKNSITVNSSTTNPDRLETKFRYKRTGVARIASTEAEAGFAFNVQ